jgi:hypothetical protein
VNFAAWYLQSLGVEDCSAPYKPVFAILIATASALAITSAHNLTISNPWPAICTHAQHALQNWFPTHPPVLVLLMQHFLAWAGVWFVDGAPPMLRRSPFPSSIQAKLVMDSNPTGCLTISDFELAGIIAHQDILAQQSIDAHECTFSLLNDSSPTISRVTKGSITSCDAAAYPLCLSSLHQHHHRYYMRYDHIAGAVNAMADDASRLWYMSDSQLLSHFQQTYLQS